MLEVKGKYNSAKIFTDVVDKASVAQVIELCNQPFTAKSRIRMMPDIHAGAGCTVGTTMTITDKVVPNLVGVDIGCGMETVHLREQHLELQKLDKLIRAKIPSGFSIREKAHRYFPLKSPHRKTASPLCHPNSKREIPLTKNAASHSGKGLHVL